MNDNQQSPLQSSKVPQQKTCEKCGAKFDCHAPSGPCWCDEIKLKTDTLASLRAKYNDCLCPTCLKAVAAAQSPNI
jgi:hypothetical protein